jgi:Papain-like cysteine protease AvrRpt2
MLRGIMIFSFAVIALFSVTAGADAQSAQPMTPNASIPKSLQNAEQFAKIKRVIEQAQSDRSGETNILGEFQIERQSKDNWCWAATAKSVSAFYNKASEWSQCKIASRALNRDCCSPDAKLSCDVYGYLPTALCITDNYDAEQRCDPDGDSRIALNFDTVAREIRAGHPIGVRIVWQRDGKFNGAHFVVIYGYKKDASGTYYLVADPIGGKQPPLLENNFRHNYQGSGVWTQTYLTRPEQGLSAKVSLLELPLTAYRASAAQETNEIQLARAGIKFGTGDNRFTALIEEARPFLDLGDSKPLSSDAEQSTLAMPHAIYIAGLKQLADSPDPLPSERSGTRVLETADGRLVAAYDFSGTGGAAPNLVGGISDKSEIAALASGLQVAAELTEKGSVSPELRLLKVPALNFEALWLHYGGSAEDVFIPIAGAKIPMGQQIGTKDLTISLRALGKQRMESGPERRLSAP